MPMNALRPAPALVLTLGSLGLGLAWSPRAANPIESTDPISQCVLAGSQPIPRGTLPFDAANGEQAIAQMTGATLPLRMSEIPAMPGQGRAKIETSDGVPSVRLEGYGQPVAPPSFASFKCTPSRAQSTTRVYSRSAPRKLAPERSQRTSTALPIRASRSDAARKEHVVRRVTSIWAASRIAPSSRTLDALQPTKPNCLAETPTSEAPSRRDCCKSTRVSVLPSNSAWSSRAPARSAPEMSRPRRSIPRRSSAGGTPSFSDGTKADQSAPLRMAASTPSMPSRPAPLCQRARRVAASLIWSLYSVDSLHSYPGREATCRRDPV